MLRYPNKMIKAPSLKRQFDIRKGTKVRRLSFEGRMMLMMLRVDVAFINDKMAITKFKRKGSGSLLPNASSINVTLEKSNDTTPWYIRNIL